MVTWRPDFCPTGGCVIELEKSNGSVNWTSPKSLITLCPHHQNIRTQLGLTDTQVFRAILFSSKLKERARWEAKLEMGLDKEHPGVPYRVNPDGSFAIVTGETGQRLTRVRNRINAALTLIERPLGVSGVTVE